jgi:hypothetical protein
MKISYVFQLLFNYFYTILSKFLFSGEASLAALYRDRLKERGRGRALPQQCAEGRPSQLVGGEELMGGAEPSLPAHLVGLGLSCCQAPASLGQIWDLHKSVGGLVTLPASRPRQNYYLHCLLSKLSALLYGR